MAATTALPAPAEVAQRAQEINAAWQADAEMKTVLDGCTKYTSDWDDFYGGPLISAYSVTRDAGHLLIDALRVMALKTAVYELTGDELLAELPAPAPVDVTCHALCAQFTALSRIQQRTGQRYWIPAAESERRRQVLDGKYAAIGITDRGMTSAIGYAATA